MSREALYSLLGEAPSEEIPNKKEPILRIRTNLKLRGKIVWMFWCRGHRKVTTDPDFILSERGWEELTGIFAVFYIKDVQDDGRAAAWIKQEIKEGRLK